MEDIFTPELQKWLGLFLSVLGSSILLLGIQQMRNMTEEKVNEFLDIGFFVFTEKTMRNILLTLSAVGIVEALLCLYLILR